ADVAQLLSRNAGHLLVTDGDGAGGGVEKAVQHPDQCGLAGTRQPHHDEDFSLLDLEGGVDDGRRPEGGDVFTARAAVELPDGFLGTPPKDFVDLLCLDGNGLGHVISGTYVASERPACAHTHGREGADCLGTETWGA